MCLINQHNDFGASFDNTLSTTIIKIFYDSQILRARMRALMHSGNTLLKIFSNPYLNSGFCHIISIEVQVCHATIA